ISRCSTIKAILILGHDGRRIIAKYYGGRLDAPRIETSLFAKTSKNLAAEIVMFEGYTCVFKSNWSQILKKNVEKRALLDSLDLVFLAIDELCDSGIVLETDSIQLCVQGRLQTRRHAAVGGLRHAGFNPTSLPKCPYA
uniref:Coatomer subunit zeta n=1 Tax=Macrostomum lignano TaxID=282301 RepID=A0A1I8FA52_9PLAT